MRQITRILGQGRPDREGERGQMLVLFTLVLLVMIAVAGLLLDGGLAAAARRQAQNAADTAALAAAKAATLGDDVAAAARTIGTANGFGAATTDCNGNTVAGIAVYRPPITGPNAGKAGYVEIVAQRAMRTAFAGIVGQSCWMVSARAVAVADQSAVVPCNFCSLNNTDQNHTLILRNSATLRVDGEIYVDSTNGGTTPGVCPLNKWKVCGDGFDIFGAGGYISAKAISVVGGWETHDENIATADELALKNGAPCPEHPNPPSQAQTANVCVHMPYLPDPLNDPAKPGNIVPAPMLGSRPIAGQNGCPSYAISATGTQGSPSQLTISSGTPTICPGTYYGGLRIKDSARVTMMPGIYIMAGGGLQVINSAGVDGSAGVMIYNSSGSGPPVNTGPGVDHVPAPSPSKVEVRSISLTSTNNASDPGESTTYTLTVEKRDANPVPTGTATFYDGDTVICSSVLLVPNGDGKKAHADCVQTYGVWGTHAISAVYSGDEVYNPKGDTLTQTVRSPGGAAIGPVTLLTTGPVELYGPKAGSYGGLTIFQERTSNLTITIDPGTSSAPNCPSGFMTASISGAAAWKDGCGAIGGLQGTVYAPAETALVLIEASGLAPLQVIAGEIQVSSGADARFAYNSAVFANGQIHLVE